MSTQHEIPRYPIGEPTPHVALLPSPALPAAHNPEVNLLSQALKGQQEEIIALKLKVANQATQLRMLHLAITRRNAKIQHHVQRLWAIEDKLHEVLAIEGTDEEQEAGLYGQLYSLILPPRPARPNNPDTP